MAMWDASVAEIGAPPVKSAQREGTQRGFAKRPLAFAAALAVR